MRNSFLAALGSAATVIVLLVLTSSAYGQTVTPRSDITSEPVGNDLVALAQPARVAQDGKINGPFIFVRLDGAAFTSPDRGATFVRLSPDSWKSNTPDSHMTWMDVWGVAKEAVLNRASVTGMDVAIK